MTDIKDGDSETKNFAFEVTHGEEITVKIKNNIEVDSILSEVLWVRIELDDIPTVLKMRMRSANVIYEGLLKDLEVEHTIAKNDANLTNLYYKVTVYAVGLTEEYCGNELVCDITWTLGDTDEQLKVSNHTFVSYEKPTPPPVVITPDLSFGSVNSGDNTPFDMEELKDGDSAVKYFAFNVVHPENITVSIHTLVSIDTGLSEVLKAKLELVGTDGNVTLYEGPLNVLAAEHTLTQNDSNRTAVYYKLTVTADGLTEEYCEKRFVCELAWSLAGTSEQLRVSNNYFEGYEKPVTPPDPPTPEFATDIELTSRDGYDNIAFNVEDMLPGDSVSQYYCVSVTHKSNHNVSFSVKLDEGQKLADVMRIKVELLLPDADDVVLYDGYMENCSDVNVSVYAEDETVTAVYYRITAYTNGSEVGNEYVGESLTASLSWTLE